MVADKPTTDQQNKHASGFDGRMVGAFVRNLTDFYPQQVSFVPKLTNTQTTKNQTAQTVDKERNMYEQACAT
jgi:hypothetical protein